MKILLTFPPLWDLNLGPMLSLPVLASMLREKGHEVAIIDINSYLMSFILCKDFASYFKNKTDLYKQELENDNKLRNSGCESDELLNLDIREYYKDMIGLYERYSKNSAFIDKYPDIRTAMGDLFKKNIPDFNNLCKMLRWLLTKILKKKYIL